MDKHPIGPVIEHYGNVTVTEGNGWRKIKCPFHGDSHASATVNTEINAFKCFACDMAGDTYTIIMKKEGVGFRDAITIAERLSGISNSDISKFATSSSRLSKTTRNIGGGRKYVPPRSSRRPTNRS